MVSVLLKHKQNAYQVYGDPREIDGYFVHYNLKSAFNYKFWSKLHRRSAPG